MSNELNTNLTDRCPDCTSDHVIRRYREMNDINKGLNDQRAIQLIIIAGITGFVVLFGSLFFAWGGLAIVGIKADLVQVFPDIILKYLFIVTAVERSASVFVGMFRNQGRVDWTLRINRINETLNSPDITPEILTRVSLREEAVIEGLVERGVIMSLNRNSHELGNIEEMRAFLLSARHTYEFQRARFNSISSRYVSRLVFIGGIVLAAFGLSVFHDILITEGIGSIYQVWVLRLIDIVITGGLLGGGSAGLNALANKVGEKIT
jgi:hypothetical protein